MKSIPSLFALFLSISALTCYADEKAGSSKIVADAKFEETSFNFGKVSEGTVVSHSFAFKNVGNADLQIQRVVSACGCTAAATTTEPIAPGASSTIKIDFDSKGFTGNQTKLVRVYSNDYDNPEFSLTLSGTVASEVVLTPARLMFNEIVRGENVPPQEFNVSISPEAGKKLSSVQTYSKFLKVEPIGAITELSGKYKVSIDPAIPVGELRDRILVNLAKGQETSSVTVPVIGKVIGPISIEPPQVSFGIVEGSDILERVVKLKNRGPSPIEIKSVSSDTASVVAEFKVIEPGKNYSIHVKLDPAQVTSDLRALIEIQTSGENEPPLYLSVFGVTPPKL